MIKIPFYLMTAAVLTMAPMTNGEEASPEERVERLHKMAGSEFRGLDELKEPIDFERIDYALLDAAVFHETNRRRVDHGLPALGFRPVLREAARIQVRGMIRMEKISHRHPDADKKTMEDRFDFLGIETLSFAENVAMTFGIRYESGKSVYPRKEEGRKIFSEEPGGKPIPPHTYASFATQLLDSWMESPGHRKNILLEDVALLGTSSLHDRSGLGMDSFYSAQEFSGELTVRDDG